MNILKNMEAVFIVALAVSASALYLDNVPAAQAHAAPVASQIAVVSVVGHRMTAEEKIISLQNERRQARLAGNDNGEI